MHESDACMETSRPSFDPQPIMLSVDALPRDLRIHCRSNMWYLKEAVVLQKSYWFCLECSFFFPFLCFTSKLSWNYHKLNLWVFHYRSWTFDLYIYIYIYFMNFKQKRHSIHFPSLHSGLLEPISCQFASLAVQRHACEANWQSINTDTEITCKRHKQAPGLGIKPVTFLLHGSWCHFKLKCHMKFSKHKSVCNIFSYKSFKAEAYKHNIISWNWCQKKIQGTMFAFLFRPQWLCLLFSQTLQVCLIEQPAALVFAYLK